MREIKFRALHVENKEMVYFNNDKLVSDVYQMNHLACLIRGDYGDVLMQFTGLLDKNGREIYEGDILRGWIYNPKELHVVKYISDKYNCGFMASSTEGLGKIHVWYDGLEVVGNIHENPDLLEGLK